MRGMVGGEHQPLVAGRIRLISESQILLVPWPRFAAGREFMNQPRVAISMGRGQGPVDSAVQALKLKKTKGLLPWQGCGFCRSGF